MLTANEIKEALKGLLNVRYPDRPCYTKLLPRDFARPSTYLEFLQKTAEPGNIALTGVTAKIRCVSFVPVDPYSDADDEAADMAADELLELFLGNQVEAGGRSLDVVAADTEYGSDFGAAVLTVHYLDDTPEPVRSGPPPRPDPKLIEKVFINRKEI